MPGAFTFGILFGVLSFLVGILIDVARVRIGLDFCDQKPANYTSLYSSYTRYVDFLVGTVLYALLVTAGLILLIIQGIYRGIRFKFYGYLILDRGMEPMEAMREKSGSITRGSWWHLFVFWLAVFGIFLLGLIACGLGVLASLPLIMVSTA